MPKGKKGILGEGVEGTMDIFGDLKTQGKDQSGLDDDIFGFKSELDGKKKGKGKKGKDELDIGNIYGDLG
jgi:hypothetical protein